MHKLIKYFSLLLCLFCLPGLSLAQELFCTVTVNANQMGSDRQIYEDLQQAVSRYLNLREWTDDKFENNERIKCNLQIIVNNRPSADYFMCTANLQIYRPVHNSTYETIVANLSDPSFNFRYVAFQELQYSENAYNDNLTAMLNYYAYIILGLDYDSFSNLGGTPHFAKAQEVVSLATSASQERGWRSGESQRNRYWLSENLLNNRYKSFRVGSYKYHRQGLDQMEGNAAKGRRAILDTVRDMKMLRQQNPLIMILKTFLDAKGQELTDIFSNAFINDKKQFVELMMELDPANANRYQKIMETK